MALIDLPDEMIHRYCSCDQGGRITNDHHDHCNIFGFLKDLEELGIDPTSSGDATAYAEAREALVPINADPPEDLPAQATSPPAQFAETRPTTGPEEVTVWLPKSVIAEGHLYRVVGLVLTHAIWREGVLVGLSNGRLVSEALWDDGGTAKPIHSLGDVVDPSLTSSELIQALRQLTPGSESP